MSLPSSDPSKLSKKFLLCSIVLIVVMGFLSYANSFSGQFLWDDESLIQYNPYIKDGAHVAKIFTSRMGSTAKEAGAFYRPVQTFSYFLDYSMFRLNPTGYHVINVVWHILVALALFILTQILFKNGKVSLLTAVLFVVHPLHTEAVAYISGRADSLAAFFMLGAYIVYLKHDQKKGILILCGMSLSYALALLSRENSIILPLLIGFYHYAFKKPVDRKAFLVLVGTVVLYVLWRIFVIKLGNMTQGEIPTMAQRFPGVFVALANYYRLLILPFDLHMEYGGILFPITDPGAILGFILSVVLVVYAFFQRKQNTFLFFSIGWFVITWLPVSNLVIPINAYMAEHWLYLPLIGFAFILAKFLVGLLENPKSKGIAITLMGAVLIFYTGITIKQNQYWNNDIRFYKRMLRYAPQSSRLYNNLAKAYHDAGKNDELIDLLKSAIQLQPDNALAHNNLGNAYKGIGKFEEAIGSYRQAIQIDPLHAGPYYNLSTIYSDVIGDTEEAIALLSKSIELSPHFAKAYNKLGLIYLEQGKKDDAIALLNKSLKLNPDDPEIYHNFGYIYVQSGDQEDAIKMYQKAIAVNPNYAQAHHDLAVIYFTQGQYKLAVQYCDQSVALGYVDQRLLESVKSYR